MRKTSCEIMKMQTSPESWQPLCACDVHVCLHGALVHPCPTGAHHLHANLDHLRGLGYTHRHHPGCQPRQYPDQNTW